MTALLKIRDMTDGVTNCSSEVFVVRNDDSLRDLIAGLENPVEDGALDKYCEFLNNERSVKDFVLKHWHDEDLDNFNKILKYNPLAELFPEAFEEYGLDEDLLWKCFKRPYLEGLIDYVSFDVPDFYDADTFEESNALAAISNYAWGRDNAVAWHY